jgi:hypothetical protein
MKLKTFWLISTLSGLAADFVIMVTTTYSLQRARSGFNRSRSNHAITLLSMFMFNTNVLTTLVNVSMLVTVRSLLVSNEEATGTLVLKIWTLVLGLTRNWYLGRNSTSRHENFCQFISCSIEFTRVPSRKFQQGTNYSVSCISYRL